MGYQVVDVTTTLSERTPVLILNAQSALDEAEVRSRFGQVPSGYGRALERLADSRSYENIRVLSATELSRRGLFVSRSVRGDRGPADEAIPERSQRDERFIRFSAFANDLRIQEDGSVLPGTYATTYADGMGVGTGTEAVERYALPNPDPAVNRFHLKPSQIVPLRRGTVQPANGRRGEGAEILLDSGAPSGTHSGSDEIPAR